MTNILEGTVVLLVRSNEEGRRELISLRLYQVGNGLFKLFVEGEYNRWVDDTFKTTEGLESWAKKHDYTLVLKEGK